jgi:hypothetical protein
MDARRDDAIRLDRLPALKYLSAAKSSPVMPDSPIRPEGTMRRWLMLVAITLLVCGCKSVPQPANERQDEP